MSHRQPPASPGIFSGVRRYWRAFITALRYTLRGEKPPLLKVQEKYPKLTEWWAETLQLVDIVEENAKANDTDLSALTVRVDHRNINGSTILQTVKYHVEREYPYLMVHNDQFSPLTIQATSLNDQYRVQQLAEAANASLKPSLEALAVHLGHILDNSSS